MYLNMLLKILSFFTVFYFLHADAISLQRSHVHYTRKKSRMKNRLYDWIVLRQILDSTDYDYENERNIRLRDEQYL